MTDENVERYTLELVSAGADQAVGDVNKLNSALTQTLAETKELNIAQATLAEQLASPNAAQALGLTADELAQVNEQLGLATQKTEPLIDGFDQVDQSVKTIIRDLGDLGKDIQSLPEPNLSSFGVDESGDGGGISLGGARSGLRAGGFLLGSDAGGASVRAVSQIAMLTASFGPAGAAAAGFALIMRQSAEASTAAKDAEQARLVAEADITTFIQTSTREQKQQRLDALQDTYSTDLTLFDKTSQSLSSFKSQLPEQLGFVNSILSPDIVGKAQADEDSLKKLSTAMGQNQSDQELLRIAIEHGGDTAADAAQKISDAASVTAANKALTDELTQSQVSGAQAVLAADQMTTEQRKAKIDLDVREQALIQQQLGQQGLTQEAHDKLTTQYKALGDEVDYLGKLTDTYADQLAKEAIYKQTLVDANQKTLDLLSQEGSVRDKISATEADIQQVRSDAADKSQAIVADEQSKIADIQASGSEKRSEIEQNTQDNIARIQRESGQDLYNDVALRDAEKYTLDRQKEQNQLTDQQINEKKQLDSEAATEAKSIAQAQAAAVKSESDLEQSLAKELTLKNKTLQQEQVDQVNIQSAQLALSQQYGVGIVSSTERTWQAVQTIFNQIGSSIAYNLNAAANGGATTPIPYSQQVAPLPAVTGTAAGQNNSGNGARSITLNVTAQGLGMTLGQIINHTLGAFDAIVGN